MDFIDRAALAHRHPATLSRPAWLPLPRFPFCVTVVSKQRMAEPERGASTSAPRKRSTPMEDDFGKDFLDVWKSSTSKNSMDYDVETVSQTGKSFFNFDKLDDFDLGGDFGKLSSFQIDMSDLDFPVSLKKTTKGNENETLIGKQDLKKDNFTFMFDFNKLDKFDPTKLDKTEIPSGKCMDDIAPNISEKELHKHDKQLDLKRDSPVISSHGDVILKNKESLSTSTSDQTLGPDPVTELEGEALPWVSKDLSCVNSKRISSLVQDTGAKSHDSFQSRNSSPVKSSNSSFSCPPKSRTRSKDATTLQNHEDDQDEVTGINKTLTGSFQVYDEVVQNSVIAIPQKHTEASCVEVPSSMIPGETTRSNVNSPLQVQDKLHTDEKNHLTKSMTLRIMNENNNMSNSLFNKELKTIGISERNLLLKLPVPSLTNMLPLKRKTLKEPLTEPKILNTFEHVNSSPKRRVTPSDTIKSMTSNILSSAIMSTPKNNSIEVQDSLQKDVKTRSPSLRTLSKPRLTKVNSTISKSAVIKETNMTVETELKLASKSIASSNTTKLAFLDPPLKIKTHKDPYLKASDTSKSMDPSPERKSGLTSPMVQTKENPEGSSNVASLENHGSVEGAPEVQNMDYEPVLIDENGNAEKAEFYSKKLADLSNMLKKKHEEAKELLVRAVVTNNRLLMLNSPMIDEKIRQLQRFATSLKSREY
ncbi:uncharacterized protein At4g18490-like isoform X4 [Zingiber officinale]|uniref:uncharacterized protein At4g18490-like isoform X4 n=1 Tax=Zingiber officinale TaxID=94328 RepID=UPI001C4ADDE7|nr:uncharacterized protein At4g18490-like isoform X4 [Zingiber officinale]